MRDRFGRGLAAVARDAAQSSSALVLVVIVALTFVVGFVDSQFWSLATVFNVAHDSLETLVFALGFLLVLLTGGIDVSFDAVGIFAGYSVALLAMHGFFDGDVVMAFVLAALIGLALGAVNALAVVGLRLPALIATLGTRSIFTGVLLSFIGSNWINSLSGQLGGFADWQLVRVASGRASVGLHVLVIPAAILCVVLALVLGRTMLGRGLYAVGGDAESARRLGFPVGRLRASALLMAGGLAGVAGMIHVSLISYANPYDLVGFELSPIAAVILGGASIVGGRGSITGTVLGAILISLINYSLVLLGAPTTWDEVLVGAFILVGITAQLMRERSASAPRALVSSAAAE